MADMILGIETSCDETAAAVVERATRPLVGRGQPDRPPRPLRRCRPRDRQPCPRRAAHAGGAQALVESGVADQDIEAFAATAGPGLVGSLLVGVSAARPRPRLGRALCGRQSPRGASVRRVPRGARPRAAAGRAAGVGRPHAAGPHGGPRRLPILGSTIDHAAGEAFDKVARFFNSVPGGPVIDRIAADGDPHAIAFPGPCSTVTTIQLQRAEDRVVNHVRKHPTSPPPTWLPASRRPWSTCWITKPAGRPETWARGALPRRRGGGEQLAAPRFVEACDQEGIRPFVPAGRCAPTTPR